MTYRTGEPTSRGVEEGEASAPRGHPSWGAVKRHRSAGESLCEECREFCRDYYRDYQRQARRIPAFQERRNASHRQWSRRITADPVARARRNAANRARYRRQLTELRAYVDPVVVDRLVRGEPAPATRRERQEAVRVLRERGASYSAIAGLVGVSERQVHRDLRDLGLVRAA